eukprot:4553074-Prymnesium_polylepis.1
MSPGSAPSSPSSSSGQPEKICERAARRKWAHVSAPKRRAASRGARGLRRAHAALQLAQPLRRIPTLFLLPLAMALVVLRSTRAGAHARRCHRYRNTSVRCVRRRGEGVRRARVRTHAKSGAERTATSQWSTMNVSSFCSNSLSGAFSCTFVCATRSATFSSATTCARCSSIVRCSACCAHNAGLLPPPSPSPSPPSPSLLAALACCTGS